MKKEFLFEEFLRHDRKQHKVISRTLRRQRVVVRIRTIFIRCALCLHFAFLKKTFWKQARSNFKEKIRKKGAKKKKKRKKRDRFENFVSAVALLTTNHLWITLLRACI